MHVFSASQRAKDGPSIVLLCVISACIGMLSNPTGLASSVINALKSSHITLVVFHVTQVNTMATLDCCSASKQTSIALFLKFQVWRRALESRGVCEPICLSLRDRVENDQIFGEMHEEGSMGWTRSHTALRHPVRVFWNCTVEGQNKGT